ncbi:MAG TPA: nodulation protein NfeD [Deltaproteobacteria bacterium]|nr:nodulation protein NfeD [Deltaproteobacteria bacterium]
MGRHEEGHVRAGIEARAAWFAWAVVALLAPSLSLAAEVMVLDVKDAITPPVAQYLVSGIDEAIETNRAAVIIRLDTPGGLDDAMRTIIQKMMGARVPVIVYVYPKGARAASAGALITLASDVAAMAPGTNIGAAHPVSVGGGDGGGDGEGKTMTEKVTNDAVAYARSIARERGRDEGWAEDIVRKSVSTPAREALEKGVVDIVAEDMQDLLAKLDGRKIKKNSSVFTLKTKDAVLVERPMGFRERFLAAIANPNVAYILMLIGLAGIYFEFSSPGAVLPGVVGGICLILAFFAFQSLPVNYAGFGLILLAAVMFIAEIKVPSYGLLTVGGIVSMVLGALLLFRDPQISAQVSFGVILPVTVVFAAFIALTVFLVVKAHRSAPRSGVESLVGETARVAVWNADGTGKVFCHGEYWDAVGPASLRPDDRVVVTRVRGLNLEVSERATTGGDMP